MVFRTEPLVDFMARDTLKKRIALRLPAPLGMRLDYVYRHGVWPSLRDPKTYSEWVFRYKSAWSIETHPEFVTLSDKVAVKTYVDDVLGPGWTTPTLWSGTDISDLPDTLPRPFMLKSNNSSGAVEVVTEETTKDRLKRVAAAWRQRRFPDYMGELWYNHIPFRLLAEPLLVQDGRIPDDYKVFCFGGKVGTIQVIYDRHGDHKRYHFDRNWTKQNIGMGFPIPADALSRPAGLDRMIEAAETLAAPFEFARIDFYVLADGLRFGEITFASDSGYRSLRPADAGRKLAEMWREGRRRIADRGGRLVDP